MQWFPNNEAQSRRSPRTFFTVSEISVSYDGFNLKKFLKKKNNIFKINMKFIIV